VAVRLAWLKHDAGKIGVMRGIGKKLRFEAKGATGVIDRAGFSGDRSVEKIASVKLHAGEV
jgi:hypothetical protein